MLLENMLFERNSSNVVSFTKVSKPNKNITRQNYIDGYSIPDFFKDEAFVVLSVIYCRMIKLENEKKEYWKTKMNLTEILFVTGIKICIVIYMYCVRVHLSSNKVLMFIRYLGQHVPMMVLELDMFLIERSIWCSFV